jgi:hypothetical protein
MVEVTRVLFVRFLDFGICAVRDGMGLEGGEKKFDF